MTNPIWRLKRLLSFCPLNVTAPVRFIALHHDTADKQRYSVMLHALQMTCHSCCIYHIYMLALLGDDTVQLE